MDRAVGAQRDRLVQRAHRAGRAHRHRDDLLHLGGAALSDLHRGLDRVGVVRVEVLLSAAVHPTRGGVDPLLNRRVRDLFDEDADLHLEPPVANEASGSYYVD
jgi:hypothetical protein